jgi:hypothetical protein
MERQYPHGIKSLEIIEALDFRPCAAGNEESSHQKEQRCMNGPSSGRHPTVTCAGSSIIFLPCRPTIRRVHDANVHATHLQGQDKAHSSGGPVNLDERFARLQSGRHTRFLRQTDANVLSRSGLGQFLHGDKDNFFGVLGRHQLVIHGKVDTKFLLELGLFCRGLHCPQQR